MVRTETLGLNPQACVYHELGRRLGLGTILLLMVSSYSDGRQTPVPPGSTLFTTAGQIRQLSRAEANRGFLVDLRGVITFRDNDGVFICDSTGCIAVDAPKLARSANPGDLVDLRGATVNSGFAPEIEATEITILSRAPIGPPLRPTFDQMASTELDSQWVEIEGIVHAVTSDEGNTALEVAVNGGRVLVRIPSLSKDAGARLVDAKAAIRGNCGAIFNDRNQWVGVRLYVSDFRNVRVEIPQADPSKIPLFKIAELRSFNRGRGAAHRVRIRGVVTFNGSDGPWQSLTAQMESLYGCQRLPRLRWEKSWKFLASRVWESTRTFWRTAQFDLSPPEGCQYRRP